MTTADDKSNGEFSCELNDLAAASWRRAIQVQVVGKLKSFADFLEILTINNYNIILSSFSSFGPSESVSRLLEDKNNSSC